MSILRSGEKVYSLGKKITGSCFAKSSKMEKKLKMTQQTNTLFDRWIYGVSFLINMISQIRSIESITAFN